MSLVITVVIIVLIVLVLLMCLGVIPPPASMSGAPMWGLFCFLLLLLIAARVFGYI